MTFDITWRTSSDGDQEFLEIDRSVVIPIEDGEDVTEEKDGLEEVRRASIDVLAENARLVFFIFDLFVIPHETFLIHST